jgi:PAS domain S-box-containing protein
MTVDGKYLAEDDRLDAAEVCPKPFWELIAPRRDHVVVVLDPFGTIASWHVGAQAVTGHEAHEIIGAHVSRLYPAEAIERGWPELELKVAAVQERFETEAWRVRRDGSRFWAHVVLIALRDSHGELRGFGNLTRELQRPRDTERVERGERRMDGLIAMLSHELRNPLAAIRNAVSLMRIKQLADAEMHWMISILDRQSAQLVRLADWLLENGHLRLDKDVDSAHSWPQVRESEESGAVEADRYFVSATHFGTLSQLLSSPAHRSEPDCKVEVFSGNCRNGESQVDTRKA